MLQQILVVVCRSTKSLKLQENDFLVTDFDCGTFPVRTPKACCCLQPTAKQYFSSIDLSIYVSLYQFTIRLDLGSGLLLLYLYKKLKYTDKYMLQQDIDTGLKVPAKKTLHIISTANDVTRNILPFL